MEFNNQGLKVQVKIVITSYYFFVTTTDIKNEDWPIILNILFKIHIPYTYIHSPQKITTATFQLTAQSFISKMFVEFSLKCV